MHHSVELVDIHVRFGNTEILQGVNVEAKPWEFVSIVGANGAGKTTLLKVVNGILIPSMGRVSVLGQDLHLCNRVSALRKDIAVVPQKMNSIRFPIRVEEAVMMGRYGKVGLLRRPKSGDWEKTHEAMEAVGIRKFSKKLVNELSGGEQQKVALARALAQDPLILLLDEPTTYLDSASRSEIMEIIHSVHHQKGLTTLLVSHDLSLVEQYSDKTYLLERGKSYLTRSKE
jgi:ABC-type cobalamin/Fe3+-siderophores transport system ATPase subunit